MTERITKLAALLKERDLYIIILAMVVMLGFCFAKINSLSDEVKDLKRNYQEEVDTLRDQAEFAKNGNFYEATIPVGLF